MGFSKNPLLDPWNPRWLRCAILKIDMTSFFSAEGGPIWIKSRRLVQNDMSTAVIWSKSKPDVEFQYGERLGDFLDMSSQSNLRHCRVLPRGEFNGISSHSHVSHCIVLPCTWWIHCHDPRATCHITGCNHLAKLMSWSCHNQAVIIPSAILKIVFAIFYFILFLMQFGLWRAAAFVSSPIHLFIIYLRQRRRYMFSPAPPRSFVCVQDYSKTRAWVWMKCCVSTDVETWTNWLTFEPDPDQSPDAGTGFLSPIAYALQRGNVEFYYVGKIPCTYWLVLGARRSSNAWFWCVETPLSEVNTL